MKFKINYLYCYNIEDIKTFYICVKRNAKIATFKDVNTNLNYSVREGDINNIKELGPLEDFPEYFL